MSVECCFFTKTKEEHFESTTSGSTQSSQSDMETGKDPKIFTQSELNDLIRDLDLTKDKSEMLASRLHERNLLTSDVNLSQKSS